MRFLRRRFCYQLDFNVSFIIGRGGSRSARVSVRMIRCRESERWRATSILRSPRNHRIRADDSRDDLSGEMIRRIRFAGGNRTCDSSRVHVDSRLV